MNPTYVNYGLLAAAVLLLLLSYASFSPLTALAVLAVVVAVARLLEPVRSLVIKAIGG